MFVLPPAKPMLFRDDYLTVELEEVTLGAENTLACILNSCIGDCVGDRCSFLLIHEVRSNSMR